MITPKNPGAAATAVAPSRCRTRTLAALLVAAALLTLMPVASASASHACNDGWGNEIQLLSGDFGLPIWLGVQYLDDGTGASYICYGTGAPGSPKTLGGMLRVGPTTGTGVHVRNWSDDNSALQAELSAWAQPTYTVDPGGYTAGGQEITFEIPFGICSGTACYDNPPGDVATTGFILGRIGKHYEPGGISAAYYVDQLCLIVNGIEVTNCGESVDLPGATITNNDPVNVGTGDDTPGPCLVGVCIPSIDYVGTSGQKLATIYAPGLNPIPVYGVRVCLFQANSSTQCPA